MSDDLKTVKTFEAFYPLYLKEHQHPLCRRMHFIGTGLGITGLFTFAATGFPEAILGGLIVAYAFAWAGHVLFEKNKPATFKRPLFSLMGDLAMFRDMVAGRIPF